MRAHVLTRPAGVLIYRVSFYSRYLVLLLLRPNVACLHPNFFPQKILGQKRLE